MLRKIVAPACVLWLVRTGASATALPRPDHVVIVMEENRSFNAIVGNTTDAPYINSIAQQGAVFTQSYAIGHPSLPNYLRLFSGSDQGGFGNFPPHPFNTPNLGAQLAAAGLTFAGYCEGLPEVGSLVGSANGYVADIAPWTHWLNASPARTVNQLPPTAHQPFFNFPSDYSQLPTVSFVCPTLDNSMHNGSSASAAIRTGDQWIQTHLDGYYQWAKTHNSMLIIHYDEDEFTVTNHIPTIFAGPMVKPGQYSETINHFNVLRTLEEMYGLPYAGSAASATAMSDALMIPGPAVCSWKTDANGNWSIAGNWQSTQSATPFVPSGIDATAKFGVVALTAPRTVTVDLPVVSGGISFSGATPYTLAHSSGNGITMDVSSGTALLSVSGASHTIAAPVTLNDNLAVSVSAAGALTLTNLQSSAANISLSGGGMLTVNNARCASLTVNDGTLRVAANGGAAGVSKVASLTIAPGAALDLTDNKLITTGLVGTYRAGAYSGVSGLIASGRNGGAWNGSGIITSKSAAAASGTVTTIGVASGAQVKGLTGSQTALWGAQTVHATDTLVMYTYAGDTNLDGAVNGDDYFRIDSHYAMATAGDLDGNSMIDADDYFIIDRNHHRGVVGGGRRSGDLNTDGHIDGDDYFIMDLSRNAFMSIGFASGDFNYDGRIDADDYFLIDSAFSRQTTPFSSAATPGGVTVVPEPASQVIIMVAIAAAGFARGRRRH